MRRWRPALVATVMLAAAFAPASAQDWPAKPVRLVVPFAPGGASDSLARLVGDKLGRRLGQQFIVENRGGAGGMLGSDQAAKSAPDGYTLVVSGIASHVIAPSMTATPPFDPMKSFTHIALFGGPPNSAMWVKLFSGSNGALGVDAGAMTCEAIPDTTSE